MPPYLAVSPPDVGHSRKARTFFSNPARNVQYDDLTRMTLTPPITRCMCLVIALIVGNLIVSSALFATPNHSVSPPSMIAGSWKVCKTVAVADVLGNDPEWGDSTPIGKVISFSSGAVAVDDKRYPIVDYKTDEISSPGDFEAIYAINAGRVGIKSHQVVVTANFVDRNLQGIETSEIFPIRRGYLLLNWNRWFLGAVPAEKPCPVRVSKRKK